ncbi:MAG: hypothetical protein AAFX09_05390 [Pseudomonadota bacterium]
MLPLRLILLAASSLAMVAALPDAEARVGGAPSAAPEQDDARSRRITPAESYVAMEPIVAGVQADYRLRGLIHIEFGLDAEEARERRRIARLTPHLRDAYTSAMATFSGTGYRYGDVPDADHIAGLLQEATDSVLGPGRARVLLGMVIIHDS